MEMIIGSWVSRAIYAAAKLRLADHLADGPRSAGEIAVLAGVAARPLYRLLRTLACVGVFAREGNGQFRLNPLAELLRDGGPESLRALSIMIGEEQDQCWDDLCETVRTGETAFARLYGRPVFDFLNEHPEQAEIFDAAMIGFSERDRSLCLGAARCDRVHPYASRAHLFGEPISADGTTNGIVWSPQVDAFASTGPAILRAYDANDLSTPLYSSNQAGPRDTAGGGVKFTTPTIANGMVYLGTQFEIDVYGLLPRSTDQVQQGDVLPARRRAPGTPPSPISPASPRPAAVAISE
jgi:hypothetical protein